MNEESRKKALEYGMEAIHKYSDAMKELAEIERQEREQPFYRFFAIDYLATGEGRSFWLMICRNYPFIGDRDRQKEKFVNFIGMGADHYMYGFEELTEEEFFKKYDNLIPDRVRMMVDKRDQPIFTWQTHYHFNYA